MRIALIGANGQLGSDLVPLLGDDVVALGHNEIEITNAESVAAALAEIDCDLVINTAAYNSVDHAEDEPQAAFAVNAFGPRNLALFCNQREIPLLHVSTDYVFGLDTDRSTPYCETDTPSPVSAYGTSKLTGEFFVRSLCPKHFVVRTCGLYGHAALREGGKGNFVETMLRLGSERDELQIVNDQHCTPTSTADLARGIAALIETEAYGLYHATNAGSMTWCELATEIFRMANIDIKVTPIDSDEFGAKAQRPSYSVLDNSKLITTIGFELQHWQDALAAYLQQRPKK